MDNSESLIIRRAIDGDAAAQRALWTRHAPHIDTVVRRLVGTLLLVGAGRLTEERFAAILAAGVPQHPGAAVAACGLCLVGVSYPPGAVDWKRVG